MSLPITSRREALRYNPKASRGMSPRWKLRQFASGARRPFLFPLSNACPLIWVAGINLRVDSERSTYRTSSSDSRGYVSASLTFFKFILHTTAYILAPARATTIHSRTQERGRTGHRAQLPIGRAFWTTFSRHSIGSETARREPPPCDVLHRGRPQGARCVSPCTCWREASTAKPRSRHASESLGQ